MKKVATALIALALVGSVIYAYSRNGNLFSSDTSKPWWKGSKVVLIYPEGDPGNSFEVYAESDGNEVLSANIYQNITFSTSECGEDSTSRFCIVAGSDGKNLRITPHPTGKIDSE